MVKNYSLLPVEWSKKKRVVAVYYISCRIILVITSIMNSYVSGSAAVLVVQGEIMSIASRNPAIGT